MIHEMKLNDKAFNNIKSGTKKFELRIYDDRRKNINLGDTIIFHSLNNLNNTISVRVLALLSQPFKAKVTHIWIYNRDMRLIKDYFLGGN